MTHADAFLRDILAHPDDDAPRLIFADWLEEQGDANSVARAEFIRVQCAFVAENLPLNRQGELKMRQQQLLNEWGKQWAHPVRSLVRDWKFHRGFIDEITIRADRFLTYTSRLFRCTPIQCLRLLPAGGRFGTEAPFYMADLACNEYLRRLLSLDLRKNQLDSRDVRALVVSEHLTSLTALDLSHNHIGDAGIRALAGSPLLGRLRYLNLWGNDLGTKSLRALAHALEELDRSADGLRLQRLDLSLHNLSTAGLCVIHHESPLLNRLVRWRS
jgi:uncharacterized protein (TIGR02996 family)